MKSFYNSLKSTILNAESNNSAPTISDSDGTPKEDINDTGKAEVDPMAAEGEEKIQEEHGKTEIRPAQIANKFLKMAARASSNISAMVNEKTLMGNIEKERQKFIGELSMERNPNECAVLGQLLSNAEAQQHIISISAEATNFTQDPPIAVDLGCIIEEIKVSANQLFSLDPRLKEVRFALVPKQVSEEKFWQNYAYKLSLVKKVLDDNNGKQRQMLDDSKKMDEPKKKEMAHNADSFGEEDESLEKELLNDLDDEYEVVNGGAGARKDGDQGEKQEQLLDDEQLNEEIDALLQDDGGNEGEEAAKKDA